MQSLSNKAFLIRKESLKKHFKLTFLSKNNKEFFLILHEDKKNLYNQLAENHYYYYQRKKGWKGYSFITFVSQYSELEITKEQKEIVNKRNQELKLVFIQQIAQNLKQKNSKQKEIISKIEQFKIKISQLNSNNSAEYLLNWAENLLISYWMKLKDQAPNQKSIIGKKIERTISKLSALFMSDYIYNDNCQWIDKKEVFCPNCWKSQENYLTGLLRKNGFNPSFL